MPILMHKRVIFQFFVNHPVIMPSVVAEEYEHATPHAMGLVPFRNYVRFKHIVLIVPVRQEHSKADQVLQYTPRPLDRNTKDGANM